MKDCIFCKIVRGEIPCRKVYENDQVLAFDDIHPMAPHHVVVVPRKHVPTVMDLAGEDLSIASALTVAAQEVARIKGMDGKGFRMVINCNADGGQVVFHLHMHVLGGRKLNDDLG